MFEPGTVDLSLHESLFTVRLLNSSLVALGDWIYLSALFFVCRIRSTPARRVGYACAVAHSVLAFFLVSPFSLVQLRVVLGDARVLSLFPRSLLIRTVLPHVLPPGRLP